MRLETLRIKNFKGIKNFTLNADGGDVSIYGDNATGKTTIVDAMSWLLFDKDYSGNAQFEIKELRPDGEAVHQLQHEVEGVFDCGGGRRITLKKVYAEKWTKKRGSSQSEFSGHTTEHYIDDVPVQQKVYKAKVGEIAPEETFRLLTSPTFFASTLPWEKRRAILLDVCGDVTNSDVIASNKALAPLSEILTNRSQEDHVKIVKAAMAKINKAIEQIPVRIDEALNSAVTTESIDLASEESNLTAVKSVIDALKTERAKVEAGGQAAELKRQIAELDADIIRADTERERETQGQVEEFRKKARIVRDRIDDRKKDILRLQTTEIYVQEGDPDTSRIDEQMNGLRAEWAEVDASTYNYEEKICLSCGQVIPEDPDAEEKFADRKKRRLDEINAEGRKLKASRERLIDAHSKQVEAKKADIEARKDTIKMLEEAIEKDTEHLKLIEAEQNKVMAVTHAVKPTDEYRKAVEQRDLLADRLSALTGNGTTAEVQRINAEIAGLNAKAAELGTRIAMAKSAARAIARADELRAEEKKLSKEYDGLTSQLYLLDKFTEAKVALLEDKVASHFEMARFKLYEKQINGGIAPMCEVLHDGVPWGNMNSGARINVGLDIIRRLSAHYSRWLPVVIDNAESVTQLLPMKCQVIRAVVSPNDKTLRIEADEKERKAA